jgi:hypothetical protein
MIQFEFEDKQWKQLAAIMTQYFDQLPKPNKLGYKREN